MKLILLIIMIMSLSSCESNDIELPFKEGESYESDYYMNFDNFLYYGPYYYLEYEGYNVVVKQEEVIQRIEIYKKKKVTERDFEKLKLGMDMFEVVERVGLPCFVVNDRTLPLLHFYTFNNIKYEMAFMGDLNNDERLFWFGKENINNEDN